MGLVTFRLGGLRMRVANEGRPSEPSTRAMGFVLARVSLSLLPFRSSTSSPGRPPPILWFRSAAGARGPWAAVRCPRTPPPCSSVNQHTGRNFTVDDSEAAKKKFAEEFNFEENLKKLDLTKVCDPPPHTEGSPTVSVGGGGSRGPLLGDAFPPAVVV